MHSIDLTGVRPRTSLGVLAAVAAVAITTALIYPLREVVPAVSTGVTYLIAVLLISTIWGLRLGLLTALLSALCFNFFHIPPTGRLSISDGENWVALVVFFVAAAIASTLAELARSRAEDAELRRREANLSADLARLLLVGVAPDQALGDVSRRLAEAMGIEWAVVAFDADRANRPDAVVIPLAVDGEPDAVLLVPAAIGSEQREQLSERVAPALATLLTAAVERAGSVPRPSRLRRSAAATSSRPPCCGPSRMTSDSADIDRRGRGGARIGRHHRRGAGRAGRGRPARVDPPVETRRSAPRPLAPRGRRGRSASRVVVPRGDRPRRGGPDPRRGFELAFEPGLPLVNADGAQLERALVNVLENAKGHSAGEPVSVHGRAVGSRLVCGLPASGIPQSRSSSACSSPSTGASPGLGPEAAAAPGSGWPSRGDSSSERRDAQGRIAARPGNGRPDRTTAAAERVGGRRRGGRPGRRGGAMNVPGARLRRRAADPPCAA